MTNEPQKNRLRNRIWNYLKDTLEDRKPPFKAEITREDKDIVRVLAILYGFFLIVMPYIPIVTSTIFDVIFAFNPAIAIALLLTLILFPMMSLNMSIEILKSLLRLGLTHAGAVVFCLFAFLVSLTYLSFTILAVQSIEILTPEITQGWSEILLLIYGIALAFYAINVMLLKEFQHAKEAAEAGDPWYDSAKTSEGKDAVVDAEMKSVDSKVKNQMG